MSSRTGKFHILARLLIVVLGTLAVGEWWGREYFRRSVEQVKFSDSDLYYYYDRRGFRRHIPAKVGYERMWDGRGKARFRINSWGFRGPEIGLKKGAKDFRILFLGDSITLGMHLPEDQTFVFLAGRMMNHAGGWNYDVINGGVSDVGLFEEKDSLEGNGLKIRPDLVVLCWYLNDARPPVGFPEEDVVYKNPIINWMNNARFLQKSCLGGYLYARLRGYVVARNYRLMHAQNQHIGWNPEAGASGRWKTDARAFADVVKAARYDWGDAWNEKSLRGMVRKIQGLRDLAASGGARFAVVMMPVKFQVYSDLPAAFTQKPQRELVHLLKAAGIPVFDLIPALKARRDEPLFLDWCHYTPRGSEVIARAITNFLLRSSLLMKRRGGSL